MAAQWEVFSTTLPFIELRSPIVPNKTNLIDPVYKNLCAAVKDLFLGFLYLFIHSVFPPCRVKPCMRHKEIRFIPLYTKKGRIQRRNSKVSKLDQWSQQSIKGRVPQVSALVVSSKWTFKTAGTESTLFKWTTQGGHKLWKKQIKKKIQPQQWQRCYITLTLFLVTFLTLPIFANVLAPI